MNKKARALELRRMEKLMANPEMYDAQSAQTNMFDQGALIMSDSGKHIQLKSVHLMDKEELQGELTVILTVGTLMLGVIFTVMVSVNREEIAGAVAEDIAQCATSFCFTHPAYHNHIYISGILCAEICAGCMMTVMVLQFSFNLLNVNARDIVGGAMEYHAYRYIIACMHILILISFLAGSWSGMNVIYVKVRDNDLQAKIFYVAILHYLGVATMISYVFYRHRKVRHDLYKLKGLRSIEVIRMERSGFAPETHPNNSETDSSTDFYRAANSPFYSVSRQPMECSDGQPVGDDYHQPKLEIA